MSVHAYAPPPPATAEGGSSSARSAMMMQTRPNPWILRPEDLEQSPSRRDGVAAALEKGYRRKTSFFIDECGNKLKLPRLAIATAHVFLQRFFARQSFKKHDRFLVAQACIFLASKVEEHPQKLQKVLLACHEVRHRPQTSGSSLDPTSDEYAKLKEAVLKTERILLNTVSFDLDIEHPYEAIVSLIKTMRRSGHVNEDDQRNFSQAAVNFLNDSMRTSMCLQFEPKKIAAGIIFLSTVYLRKVPQKGPMLKKYWDLLKISERSIRSICEQVMELYDTNANFAEMRAALHEMGHLPRAVPTSAPPSAPPSAAAAPRAPPPPPPPARQVPPPPVPERHGVPPPPVPLPPPSRLKSDHGAIPPPPVPVPPPSISIASGGTAAQGDANGQHGDLKRPAAPAPSLGVKRMRSDSVGGVPLGVGAGLPVQATAPVSS